MSDQKEKVVQIRDRLNNIVDEVMREGDQEAHVIACCLALAIEELEKFLYDDEWTPSVAPYRDDRKFQIPFKKGEEDDSAFVGPPWQRKRTSVFDKYPTLAKLKKTGIKRPQAQTDLSSRDMTDWSQWERRAFREGDRANYMRALRKETGVTLRRAREYLDEMKVRYSKMWGIDDKPGDKCPICCSKDIKTVQNAQHPFWCQDCKSHWGYPWSI